MQSKSSNSKTALMIGAGPAGLTAAFEFLKHSEIRPIVLEASREIGGISRTVRYKGNRMDIGGHRFFSKSLRVVQCWTELMPPAASVPGSDAAPEAPDQKPAPVEISYQGKKRVVTVPAHLQEEPPLRGLGPLLTDADNEDTEPQRDSAADVAETVSVPQPATPDPAMRLTPPPRQHHPEPRPGADGPRRHQLHVVAHPPDQARKKPRRLPYQPLWPRALPHLLQELHRKSVGHALPRDLGRVGRPAHQGPLAHHRRQAPP